MWILDIVLLTMHIVPHMEVHKILKILLIENIVQKSIICIVCTEFNQFIRSHI